MKKSWIFHGGNLCSPLIEEGTRPDGIVADFSVNLNPLGPPPIWRDLVIEGLKELLRYPDPTHRALREAIARWEGISPEWILPGNGTAELIALMARWQSGRPVWMAVPTFTEYRRLAEAVGATIQTWTLLEETQFQPTIPSHLLSDPEGLIFLCQPNNPTGGFWPKELLLALLQAAQKSHATVVVDEAYLDLSDCGRANSVVPWIARFDCLFVLRSLTKTLALPGLRLGYLVGPAEGIQRICALQPPWSVNALAAWVGRGVLEWQGYPEYLIKSQQAVALGRARLYRMMAHLPVMPFPSYANFLLIRWLPDSPTLWEWFKRLVGRGILIRLCDDFDGLPCQRFFRLSVRPDQELEYLAQACNADGDDVG
jgi:threonine-phosphate decarboxylase